MLLTKHKKNDTERWALDGYFLLPDFDMKKSLTLSADKFKETLLQMKTSETAVGDLLPPVEYDSEVWACGVTYSRSRDAREAETDIKNVYDMVYEAERPEVFFKAIGWRVKGTLTPIRIRKDSHWNVPEPELTLLVNSSGEILGYCAGNDVSSRSIEGDNPLYLPQAKTYDGACALGPGIRLAGVKKMEDLPVTLVIERGDVIAFKGDTSTSQIKRSRN